MTVPNRANSRINLLFVLFVLLTVGAMVAVGALRHGDASAVASSVTAAGTECGCQEEAATECPAPTPTPVPTATPSFNLVSQQARAVAVSRLVSVVDVDVTNLKNGQEIFSLAPEGVPRPPQFKLLCPKDAGVLALYTTNPFQGDLLTITYGLPPLDARNCLITIKVLDPASGQVLETYEAPSDKILVKPDYIGFKHAPARIRVEVRCE
jgi:hypothetical protein